MDWFNNAPKMPRLAALDHKEGSGELCFMEMVAFMERLPHSDSPPCTCPVIAAYCRTLNDAMPDDERQRLLPYLSRVVGTVDPAREQERAEMAAMRAVSVFAAKACRGHIDDALVDAMRDADALPAASAASATAADAARAATASAAAAASAAYAAAATAVDAADAARAATASAAYAAAASAVDAADAADAARAARAAGAAGAAAAAAAADAAAWGDALQLLDDLIGDQPVTANWSEERFAEAAEMTA